MGTDSKTEENKQPMLDTDDDGIYDDWEVNGYYIKNHLVLPWPKKGSEEEKELIKQGFKKFVSNPNESHTAGDPYSDLKKASGAFDRTIHKQPGTLLLRHIPVLQLAWKNWFFQIIKILARQRENR
ncbi:binary toxin-like calcium binding domain-containing protein [Paenibacillus larvae]|uniref:binary toxin-like calcium binding domain-containing protein n=1 Tax=Paenibacillus larvae TaxID=1464 RepID=UPI002891E8E0|nr:binary toxin-like calcium binding domain-containing protein [Paenibacillus larvae]MDT2193439.1 hypothetical protein [Paenibacillus larvae]